MTVFEDNLCNDSRCEFNRNGIPHKISEHAKLKEISIIEYESSKNDDKSKKILGLAGLSLLITLFAGLSGLMYLNSEGGAGIIFLLLTLLFIGLFFKYFFEKK